MVRRRERRSYDINQESNSILQKTRSDATAFWTAFSSIAACLAAMFAGWAAFETHKSVAEASRATKAGVWLQLLNEYETPEMLASMKELRQWQQEKPKDFANVFEELLIKPRKTAEEQRQVDALDLDRRRVDGFFNNVETLCEGGIIEKEFAHKTLGGSTYRFLIDVEVPMDKAKGRGNAENKQSLV